MVVVSAFTAGASDSVFGASAAGRVASGSASSPSYLQLCQRESSERRANFLDHVQVREKILVCGIRHTEYVLELVTGRYLRLKLNSQGRVSISFAARGVIARYAPEILREARVRR